MSLWRKISTSAAMSATKSGRSGAIMLPIVTKNTEATTTTTPTTISAMWSTLGMVRAMWSSQEGRSVRKLRLIALLPTTASQKTVQDPPRSTSMWMLILRASPVISTVQKHLSKETKLTRCSNANVLLASKKLSHNLRVKLTPQSPWSTSDAQHSTKSLVNYLVD